MIYIRIVIWHLYEYIMYLFDQPKILDVIFGSENNILLTTYLYFLNHNI